MMLLYSNLYHKIYCIWTILHQFDCNKKNHIQIAFSFSVSTSTMCFLVFGQHALDCLKLWPFQGPCSIFKKLPFSQINVFIFPSHPYPTKLWANICIFTGNGKLATSVSVSCKFWNYRYNQTSCRNPKIWCNDFSNTCIFPKIFRIFPNSMALVLVPASKCSVKSLPGVTHS